MKQWQSNSLAVTIVSAGVCLAWIYSLSQYRFAGIESTPQATTPVGDTMTLTGTLFPVVSIPFNATNLELFVPANSWVQKGQVIGEADTGYSGEAINEARAVSEEESAAVSRAEATLRELDVELIGARAAASLAESELASAESAEREKERELNHRDLLLREQVVGRFDHDAAASDLHSAASARAEAQSRQDAASARVVELERRLSEAQGRLNEAATRSPEANAALRQLEGHAGRVPLLAPANGLIVAPEPVPGLVGIARDATRLCAYARVRHEEIHAVRVGEHVSIAVDGASELTLDAQVSDIAGVPADAPDGTDFLVTFQVQNPSGATFSDMPVRILLQKSVH
uniref:Ampicillin resistance protein n=1 Tax=uncultured organism TaxID=155900 RepID=A0A8A1V6B5_9ZZZZ|nr:ampicillin resistance protein [uncultured organism]